MGLSVLNDLDDNDDDDGDDDDDDDVLHIQYYSITVKLMIVLMSILITTRNFRLGRDTAWSFGTITVLVDIFFIRCNSIS